MSLTDCKISDAEIKNKNVKSAPDRLTGTASENKNIFDRVPELLAGKINEIISILISAGTSEELSAAEQIGSREIEGISGTTVGAQLLDIVAKLLDRYTKLETDTLTAEATNNLVENLDVNLTTGVIAVTKKDGTIQTWDTALEKVPATFEFVEENGAYYIKVTNVDGTSSQTDVTALMNHYTFNNSDDISFSTSGTGAEKTITATIRANSIGLDKLSLTAISTLEGYVNTAEISANKAEEKANTATQKAAEAAESNTNAKTSEEAAKASATAAASSETVATQNAETAAQKALESESWAVGGTGTREGEDTNNAKYWCEKAQETAGGDFATNEKVDTHISDAVKHITPEERTAWNETADNFMNRDIYDTDNDGIVDNSKKAENSSTAEKLKQARTIKTDLSSSKAANFDGTVNVTPGVAGILGVENGGTGVTSMTGTDYTTARPRGIILQSSAPTSVANGVLVGVYS